MKKEDVATAFIMSLPLLVFIVFLVLKLTDVISWSWWWVTFPLWIVAAIFVWIVLLTIGLLVYVKQKRKR